MGRRGRQRNAAQPSPRRRGRLGGLYALEGVMNTSSDYHQPVLEALCAFVRCFRYAA